MKKQNANSPSTILEALDRIAEGANHSRLTPQLFLDADVTPSFDYLAERLGLSPMQSSLLSAIIEESEDGPTNYSELARFFGCSNIHIKSLNADIEALVNKRLIVRAFGRNHERVFLVPKEVSEAFENNTAYEYKKPVVADENEFFTLLDKYFTQRGDSEFGSERMDELVDELLEQGKRVPFVKNFKKLVKGFPAVERLVALYFCVSNYAANSSRVNVHNLRFLFNAETHRRLCMSLAADNVLKKNGILVVAANERCPLNTIYELSGDAIAKLGLKPAIHVDDDDDEEESEDCDTLTSLVKWNTIKAKQLFYNSEEQQNMDLLKDLLTSKNYNKVQKELSHSNMRGGLNILFYGGPGTGKTEGALQLAHATHRDLFIVDFSQLRDKWVGNSEKNAKRVFSQYHALVKAAKVAPILLINEADGMLAKRLTNVERAVDRSENTIQNIILQEMENIEGIMICTTNLATNLDEAFDRRFLMKIGFERPNAEARTHIWQTMLPALTEEQCTQLAQLYDLAGGNMENVSRKYTMERILYRKEVSFERLQELCSQELISTQGNRRPIGF